MIGWGWVVSTGDWIGTAGVIGAMLGFILGGVMIFFIVMTYAELTPAMPECGGEHVFSMRAMGPVGSFVCTWAIILGYVSVVCFEACALPTIITYVMAAVPARLPVHRRRIRHLRHVAGHGHRLRDIHHRDQYHGCEDRGQAAEHSDPRHRRRGHPAYRGIRCHRQPLES